MLLLAGLAARAAAAAAQTVTTGSISGEVVDLQGGALPGAVVVAVHTPTGTTYEATSGADGRYQIQNVRVGGACTVGVTATLGFRAGRVPTGQRAGCGSGGRRPTSTSNCPWRR